METIKFENLKNITIDKNFNYIGCNFEKCRITADCHFECCNLLDCVIEGKCTFEKTNVFSSDEKKRIRC